MNNNFVTIGFMICLTVGLLGPPAAADILIPIPERIIQLLHAEQILDKEKQSSLTEKISAGNLEKQSTDTLEDILQAVDGKIKKDMTNLAAVAITLGKIRNLKLAKDAANLQTYDYKKCVKYLQQLKAGILASDNLLLKYRVAMTVDDYLVNINNKSRFLIDSEDITVPGLWSLIETTVEPVYGPWKERCELLKSEAKHRLRKGSPYRQKRDFVYEEEEFTRLFNDLQVLLKSLSDRQSNKY